MKDVEHIYLDHAATSPMAPQVIEAMTDVMASVFGNPSSIHSFGRQAHQYLETARQQIADYLTVSEEEIIFTSGGTEGDNMAILGTAMARQTEGKHIISTAIEHPAVLNTLRSLEKQGFEVSYLRVNEAGEISLEEFDALLRPDTILVTVMYANNEVGNLLPIKEIGERLREHPAYFHTDAVQAFGSQRIHPEELGIDLLSMSAHKINGPKGVGSLYKKNGVKIARIYQGGEQERKQRPGTENLAGIVGLATAVSLLTDEKKALDSQRYRDYLAQIESRLTEAGINYRINGSQKRVPHVVNFSFPDRNSGSLLMKLDLQGVAVSTGSACTAGNVQPSHVLAAMYGSQGSALRESLRISFGAGNTLEEINYFCDSLIKALA